MRSNEGLASRCGSVVGVMLHQLAMVPNTRPHWEARFESGSLHITGNFTQYPDDHSTAGLAREPDDPSASDLLVYRVVFDRDKEPFCGPDLMGPVHYFEPHVPPNKARIRVIATEGIFDFPIPNDAA